MVHLQLRVFLHQHFGVTTAPAATTPPSPIVTPPRIVALAPIQQPFPMVIGKAYVPPTVSLQIRIPILGETLIQVNRMRSCIYLYSWSYKHRYRLYGYLIAVYQHTAIIDAYIVANKYIVTKSYK